MKRWFYFFVSFLRFKSKHIKWVSSTIGHVFLLTLLPYQKGGGESKLPGCCGFTHFIHTFYPYLGFVYFL